MSSLLPNHHRSTSDRLLNNYLSSQKQLTTSLLTLLSHSHSSTSSLLAYVTSSSGVHYPIRRAVQHAGFEGPMNQDSGEDFDSVNGNASEAKWHEYIASLEHFRKELKDVHLLEEELSQVKKDREILVSRLIKATKSRPTKSDIAAAAKASHAGSDSGRTRPSNSSVLSFGSDHSNTTAGGGKSKRAEKLAEAQAEVLGCEEHLRGLEVRLEEERNKVMKHGLMERFRAMEDVGRMWQRQARLGMAELEHANGGGRDEHMLHPNAYEVESNGSIAPSQSASQVGYNSDGEQERRHRSHGRGGHVPGMAGSVTGSIAEEDENSSSDDDENLVVHENKRPGAGTAGTDFRSRSQSTIVPAAQHGEGGAGQGVPSITNIKAKPATRRQNSGSSGSSVARGPGRRTQSELGYNPPRARQNRMSIRRTPSRGAVSDASSDRSVGRRDGGKRKGGFFASIAKIFKGKSSNGSVAGYTRGARRGGADSPPLTQRNTGGWSTRTDDNIRRAVSNAGTSRGFSGGKKSRNADYSSSDDEMGGGNLVAVTNRGNNTWSIDNAKRQNGTAAADASAPPNKTRKSRSDLGAGAKARSNSQTTITGTGGKVTSKPPGVASQPVTRSNTVKSTTSGVGAGSQRTRHGSITRVGARGSTMGAPPSIAGVLEGTVPKGPSSTTAGGNKQSRSSEVPKAPGSSIVPKMAEIPKAPGSQLTPKMYVATAPPPNKAPLLQPPPQQMSSSASAPVGLGGDGYVPKAAASSVSKASKTSKATITPKTAQQSHTQQQQQTQAPAQTSQVTKSSSALADLNLGAPVGMSQPNASVDSITARASTPLPPSKTLSPPAKSAMRASSPIPPSSPVFEAPPPAFMISAPGSVIQEKVKEEDVFTRLPEPTVPAPQAQVQTQPQADRPSTPATTTDADSVYESAVEEDAESDYETGNAGVTTAQPVVTNGAADDDDDGSSVASDSTAGPGQNLKYKVIENTEGLAAKLRLAGNATPVPAATETTVTEPVAAPQAASEKPKEIVKDGYVAPAAASMTGSAIERRKSVRMNVPPSPGTPTTTAPPDSPTPEGKRESTWSSRVGRTVDSSDDEDNAAYAKARRSMNRYSSLSASKPTTTTTASSSTNKKKKKSTKA